MKRRHVLKSMGGIAAMSTIGLAGCSGGGSGPCGAPSDGLDGALPEGDDYTEVEEPSNLSGGSDVESAVYAFYQDQYGKRYGFGLMEFSSADANDGESQNMRETVTQESTPVARLTSGPYLYYATGPTENAVTNFLESSSALDSSCVDSNIEFI